MMNTLYCIAVDCNHAKSKTGLGRINRSYPTHDHDFKASGDIGNMICNVGLNNEACMWDGGDCCWPYNGAHLKGFMEDGNDVILCPQDMTHRPLPIQIVPGLMTHKCNDHILTGGTYKLAPGWCGKYYQTWQCEYDSGACCFYNSYRHLAFNKYSYRAFSEDFYKDDDDAFRCHWRNNSLVDTTGPLNETMPWTEADIYDPNRPCNTSSIGDKICEPWNNHVACQYDGGDCCNFWVRYVPACGVRPKLLGLNKQFRDFNQDCRCQFTQLPNPSGFDNHPSGYPEGRNCTVPLSVIGDGVCDDEADRDRCLNDEGDCCKPIIDASRCTECICNHDGIKRATDLDGYLEYVKDYPNYNIREHFLAFEGEHRQGGNDVAFSNVALTSYNYGLSNTNCYLPMWKTDTFCDDFWNSRQCNFDSGDCCRPTVIALPKKCTTCMCHETGKANNVIFKASVDNCLPQFIGDGICHELCNNPINLFDGGDCCLDVLVDTGHCLDRGCKCLKTKKPAPHWNTLGCPEKYVKRVGDGYCQDITNTEACLWDYGDCCKRWIMFACYVCRCHEDNEVHLWFHYDMYKAVNDYYITGHKNMPLMLRRKVNT